MYSFCYKAAYCGHTLIELSFLYRFECGNLSTFKYAYTYGALDHYAFNMSKNLFCVRYEKDLQDCEKSPKCNNMAYRLCQKNAYAQQPKTDMNDVIKCNRGTIRTGTGAVKHNAVCQTSKQEPNIYQHLRLKQSNLVTNILYNINMRNYNNSNTIIQQTVCNKIKQ